VQVDPIKSTLKAPGTHLSTLNFVEPLSNFAFNVNVCCYMKGSSSTFGADGVQQKCEVGWCRLTL
jgi:hypothetical protein